MTSLAPVPMPLLPTMIRPGGLRLILSDEAISNKQLFRPHSSKWQAGYKTIPPNLSRCFATTFSTAQIWWHGYDRRFLASTWDSLAHSISHATSMFGLNW